MLGLMKYFCSIACPGPWLPFVFGWREYLYTDNYVIPISPTSLGWVIVPGIIKESPLSSGNGGPMGTNEHASARQIILLRYGARFLERRWEGGEVRDHNGCFVRTAFLFVLPDETKPLSTISVWTKSSEIKCKNVCVSFVSKRDSFFV